MLASSSVCHVPGMAELDKRMPPLEPVRGPRESYGERIEAFYQSRISCITAAAAAQSQKCHYCHARQPTCTQQWEHIMVATSRLHGPSVIPEPVYDFSNYLSITFALALDLAQARKATDALVCPPDGDLAKFERRLKTIRFRGATTVQAFLHGAISEIWYPSGHAGSRASDGAQIALAVEETQQLYTSLATALADSPGLEATQPLPLNRSARRLQFSGDVTFAMVMHASCWFAEYEPSSVSPVVQIWSAWLPSRQSDNVETCFVASEHQYATFGRHDARSELEGHNGRCSVNFMLRHLMPRTRRPKMLGLSGFRDIMAFRSGMLVSDCVSRDNRDIAAFLQTTAQLIGLMDPSESDDLWSGQTLRERQRLGLFIRQIKHLTVCSPTPRHMTIITTLLYSLTSPRHNRLVRGRLSLDFDEPICCSPAPFCGSDDTPPCRSDRALSSSFPTQNPLTLVLQAVLQQGLDADEWQASIDARVLLCHEWSRGLRPEHGRYDPVTAAKEVAPLCIRIMSSVFRLLGA